MIPPTPGGETEIRTASLTVQQALHGYRSGHRLIASSIELPKAIQPTLAALTDAGDLDAENGFPTLLSGFPIKELELYAFTMTWPAPETRRPGAVWSHSLMVPLSNLGFLGAQDVLLSFRQPTHQSVESYSQPLSIRLSAAQEMPIRPVLLPLLLWALYGRPERPVCAAIDDLPSASRQRLLIQILLKQWPSLQAKFSFAEAPGWERRSRSGTFDLQASTPLGASSIAHANPVVRLISERQRVVVPEWVEVVGQSLFDANGFAHFLAEYGDEVGEERPLMEFLAELWLEIAASTRISSVSRVLRLMSAYLPSRSAAPSLKRGVFGSSKKGKLIRLHDAELLMDLCMEPTSSCLSASDLSIRSRARSVWQDGKRPQLLKLLKLSIAGKGSNEVRREVFKGIVSALQAADLAGFIADEEILRRVVRERPELLVQAGPWRAGGSWKPLISALPRRLRTETRTRIIQTIVQNAPPEAIGNLLAIWPGAFFTVLSKASEAGLTEDWVEFIPADLIDVDHSASRIPTGILLRLLTHASAERLRAVPFETWIQLADHLRTPSSHFSERSLAALFACSIDQAQPPADELATLAYGRLYPLALDDNLVDAEAKAILKPLVRGAESWDVAKGIAVTLADSFARWDRWRPLVLTLVEHPAGFRTVLIVDAENRRQESLVFRMLSDIPALSLQDWQVQAITEVLKKVAKRASLIELLDRLLGHILHTDRSGSGRQKI